MTEEKEKFLVGDTVYREIDIDASDRAPPAFDTPLLYTIVKIRAETVDNDYWINSYYLRTARSDTIIEVLDNEIIPRKTGELILKMIESKQSISKAETIENLGSMSVQQKFKI